MSGALTVAAVLGLAATCQSVVSPQTILKIATHESGLYPERIHQNSDGSADVGLMQINSKNFDWLGLTMANALNPCVSIRAGAEVLTAFSRYNTGSPTRGIENGYALAVQGVHVETLTPPLSSADLPAPRSPNDPPLTSVFARPSPGRELVAVSAISTKQ